MTISSSKIIPLVVLFLTWLPLAGQEKSGTASLKELLKQAVDNYPLLKSKAYEVQAAEKGVEASKRSLVPTLDASYQTGFATYNNITGMASTSFLVPISGPPTAGNNYDGVFGSSAGLILNWKPITFGERNAQVDVSKAGLHYTTADAQNEIFQHQVKVINAYLDMLTAKELVKVYEKNYARAIANYTSVTSLVASGIKPGVDSSMFRAAASGARIELLNIQKYRQQAIIYFSQLLASSQNIEVTDSSFFSRLPAIRVSEVTDSVKHPLLSLYDSNIELSRAKSKVLSKTMLPSLGVWGTTYARGSGVRYDGTVNSTEGLGFQRYNYGIGVQLSMPLLQFAHVNPRVQQQKLLVKSNEEQLNDISLQMRKQLEMADTTLNNSLITARETPISFHSSEYAYNAMLSRYRSGLANYSDLIQSQYFLVKSEAENKSACINVWKALLLKAAVKGDLNIFLNQVN